MKTANKILLFIFVLSIFNCEQSKGKKQTSQMAEEIKQMSQPTIQEVRKKYQDQIMAVPGVVGIGIGAVDDTLVIKVLVVKKTPKLEKKIPKTLEGYQVVIQEAGVIRALNKE